MGQSCPEPDDYFDDKYMKLAHPAITNVDCTAADTDVLEEIFGKGPSKPSAPVSNACSNYQNQGANSTENIDIVVGL